MADELLDSSKRDKREDDNEEEEEDMFDVASPPPKKTIKQQKKPAAKKVRAASKFIDDGAEESGDDVSDDEFDQDDPDAKLSGDFIVDDDKIEYDDDQHSQQSNAERKKRVKKRLFDDDGDDCYFADSSDERNQKRGGASMSSSHAAMLQRSTDGEVAFESLLDQLVAFVMSTGQQDSSAQTSKVLFNTLFTNATTWFTSRFFEEYAEQWDENLVRIVTMYTNLSFTNSFALKSEEIAQSPVCPVCQENFEPASRVTKAVFHGRAVNLSKFFQTRMSSISHWVAIVTMHKQLRTVIPKSEAYRDRNLTFVVHQRNCCQAVTDAHNCLFALFYLPFEVMAAFTDARRSSDSFDQEQVVYNLLTTKKGTCASARGAPSR